MKPITLNGLWHMKIADQIDQHEALIPGSVYSALLADGTMDDPFYRENELEAFELLRKDFTFSRSFDIDIDTLNTPSILLCCEGLDTLAQVTINGQKVGDADNMFVTWEWDVKNLLRSGTNEISIHFDSPIEYALDAYEKSPGWGSSDATPGFQHIRKAHCMYGWDWGPRLPDAGIWRNISLLLIDQARFDSVMIHQQHSENQVALTLTPEILGNAQTAWTAVITSPDGKEYTADEDGKIIIENPELWWPAGYGAQPLYDINVTLYADGVKQDTWNRRIGLRTLSISRDKDEWGEEFCHIINGVKVFAMGADYIPEDNILQRVNPERTRRLLEDAKLANFNTIRIWGGGYYPDNFFFDICDELGLMVWQDFMYACAYYDLTPEFEKSITLESIQNIKRLRHHASLALFCGNNEMESFHEACIHARMKGDMEAFAPSAQHHHADYIKMYEYLLPSLCEKYAPQTFYWPSSPSSGGSFDNTGDQNRGDVHYWDVWHGEKPFTDYHKFHFRYVSEFGFQSFPCLETVESFTLPSDRNIFSRIMERHQRNQAANGKILAYMSQTYLYPKDFDQLLYASQLLQADAIRYGVEHWRRNRGRCMGAIIWQLNDCWPVASWASIDYFGRWKAMHYAAKRFFAPIMISALEEGEVSQNPKINEFHPEHIERSITLCIANESRADVNGVVHWALRNPDASIITSGDTAVTVPALSSAWLDKLDFGDTSITATYASYSFEVDGAVITEGTKLFCAPKHFEFIAPTLNARSEGGEIIVTASAYAKSVCIQSDDADMLLSDNFFDMNAGEIRVKILRGSAENLRVRSVSDIA